MLLYNPIDLAFLVSFTQLATGISIVKIPPGNKAEGYVGYLATPPTRDWLLSTYCYCQTPQRLDPPKPDEGHFFVRLSLLCTVRLRRKKA